MKRRDFLKLAGTALAGAALPQPLTALAAGGAPPEDQVTDRFVPLRRGRVLTSSVTVWDQIEAPHSPVKRYARDEVLLVATAQNLRKLAKYVERPPPIVPAACAA